MCLGAKELQEFGKALLPDHKTHENSAVNLRRCLDDFSTQNDSKNRPEMKTKPTLHPALRPTLFVLLFGTLNGGPHP